MPSFLPQQHRKNDHKAHAILRSLSNKDPFTYHAFQLKKLMGKLKPKQQEIIKMKFGIDCIEMKTSEIAKELGITVQSVNGTIRNSLKIMKG